MTGKTVKRRKNAKVTESSADLISSSESEEQQIQINANKEESLSPDTTTKLGEEEINISDDELKHKPVSRRKPITKKDFVCFDPNQIDYKPLTFSDYYYEQFQKQVIDYPLKGFFYYEYLGDAIGHIFRLVIKPSGFKLHPSKIKILNFVSWDNFLEAYRFIPRDREIWKKVAPVLDTIQLAKNVCTYFKVLITLLNAIYVGYTEGYDAMNSKLSKDFIVFIGKLTKCYTKYLNMQYHKILSKEFNEFFDCRTGFGNTMNNFIKRESIYIYADDNESITNEKISNSIKWTADEKDVFYESLARYGIGKINQISELLPNKSESDILNLYNALSKGLKLYKSNKKLKKKLITFEDMPIAYEMTPDYVKREDQLSNAIEKFDELRFRNVSMEYRGNYRKEIISKCRKLFNMKNIESLLNIIAKIQNVSRVTGKSSMTEFALYDIYTLAYEYTYESMSRLFKRKMNELTIAQQFEWVNLIKALKPPPDPKPMVRILNLKDMDTEVKEDIDYFKPYASDDECSEEDGNEYDSEEVDFYPDFTVNQWGLMKNTKPNDITILDKNDIWKIAITKDDVYEVSNELSKEYNFSTKLWSQLMGKISPDELTGRIQKESSEVSSSIPDSDSEKDSDNDSNDDIEDDSEEELGDDSDDDYLSGEESEEDMENIDYAAMLSNAQDIDDLQSEDEMRELIPNTDNENDSPENDSEGELNSNIKWYDDDFFILDSNTQLNEKGMLDKSYISNIDLTTKGHEYIQKLCDEEEDRLNIIDFRESIKHENLILTQLTAKRDTDDLNADIFADLFSQMQYGGPNISKESEKPEFGGAATLLNNPKAKDNIRSIMTYTSNLTGYEKTDINPETIEKFKYTFNDY